jgi:uncharacterized alkaline shock family protein YloU
MSNKTRPARGTLKVSENAIRRIAEMVTRDVSGVHDLGFMSSPVIQKITGDNAFIYVRNIGGAVEIGINVIIKKGIRPGTIAENIQTSVKENVQDMLDIVVSKVNVQINDVV